MRAYTLGPGLLISGDFIRDKAKQQWLQDNRIDVVVCTLRRTDQDLVCHERIIYEHVPLPDARYVDLTALGRLVEIVLGHMAEGRRVLVHCLAGRNRSCLVAGVALAATTDLTGDGVVDRIRAVRGKAALANPVFEAFLRDEGYLVLRQDAQV